MKEEIYLDYAAATPLDSDVKKAMDEAQKFFANPSSQYKSALVARNKLLEAKKRVGMVLGTKSEEIVLTSGGTEADNLAIFGIARANQKFGKHLLTTATEHKAVLACFDQLKKEGFDTGFVRVDKNGLVDLADLRKRVTDQTTLVSIAYASSEIGTIQPLAHIKQCLRDIRAVRQKRAVKTPLYFHSDGSAAGGLLPLAVNRLGVDVMSLNAAKIYGPRGSGALYVKRGTVVEPIIFGGGQEQGLRAGTEDLVGAVGLAAALVKAEATRQAEVNRLTSLRDYLYTSIKKIDPAVILNGHLKKRLANNLNVSFMGRDGEDLVAQLDARGIAVATGAACSAADEEPSQALLAIGRDRTQAQGSLRITLGKSTTKAEIDQFIRVLAKILEKR